MLQCISKNETEKQTEPKENHVEDLSPPAAILYLFCFVFLLPLAQWRPYLLLLCSSQSKERKPGRATPHLSAHRPRSGLAVSRAELTHSPSRLPVTISGAPSPIPRPPTPSMLLMISLCPFTEYTGISGASKFLGEKERVTGRCLRQSALV